MSGLRNGSRAGAPSVRAENGILDNQQLVDFLYEMQELLKLEAAEAHLEYSKAGERFNNAERRSYLVTEMVRILLCQPVPTVKNR